MHRNRKAPTCINNNNERYVNKFIRKKKLESQRKNTFKVNHLRKNDVKSATRNYKYSQRQIFTPDSPTNSFLNKMKPERRSMLKKSTTETSNNIDPSPSCKKLVELQYIQEANDRRYAKLLEECNQMSPMSLKHIEKQQSVKMPDQLKWNFDDTQQKAIEELHDFFRRDSACSSEEKEEPKTNLKLSVTKIGFKKSPKLGSESKREEVKFELSDFTILHTLGKGASGVVKLAKHKNMNCKVVFKIYEKYKLMESQRKKSLFKEIEIPKSISHPNIIKLYDVLEDEK